MCVLSAVVDWKFDDWTKRYPQAPDPNVVPVVPAVPYPPPGAPYVPFFPLPTPEEIAEFRRLLEMAREIDRKTRQSEEDCELPEKKRRLLEFARALGIEDQIRFIEDQS